MNWDFSERTIRKEMEEEKEMEDIVYSTLSKINWLVAKVIRDGGDNR